MSGLAKKVANVRKLETQFRDLLAVAGAVADAAQLESKVVGYETQVEKLRAEVKKETDKLAKAKERAKQVDKDAMALGKANEAAIKAASDEAAYVVEQAREQAKAIVAEAKKEAAKVRTAAKFRETEATNFVTAATAEAQRAADRVATYKRELEVFKSKF